MSNSINVTLSSQSAIAGENVQTVQAVQTNPEEGTWMYLDAATSTLGLSEKTLRRYIQKNKLQHRRLGRQANSPLQVWITRAFLHSQNTEEQTEQAVVDVESVDVESVDVEAVDVEAVDLDCSPATSDEAASPGKPDNNNATDGFNLVRNTDLETIIKTMAGQFADKLDQQKEIVFELRKELEEKNIQLRLLPDLQKKLEEQEKLTHVHTKALEKQVEALLSEIESKTKAAEQLQQEKERLQELVAPKTKQGWWSWFIGQTPDR